MAIEIFKLSVCCIPTFTIRSPFYSSQKGSLFLPRPTSPSQSIQIHQKFNPTPLRIRWSCAAAIENLDETELIIKPAESQSPGASILLYSSWEFLFAYFFVNLMTLLLQILVEFGG